MWNYTEPIEYDIDYNGVINILDIVLLVAFIITPEEFNQEEINTGDFNLDDNTDILDIVILVEVILTQ